MKKIYRMYVEIYRMGEIESVFIADEKELKALIGKELDFGEILGKHSDIHFKLKEEYIEIITDDQDKIKIVEELDILPTGYPPFDYYTCDCCGEPMNPITETDRCDNCKKEYGED